VLPAALQRLVPGPALLLILALSLGFSALGDETNWVIINGFEAHPTRILAKYKTDNVTKSALAPLRQLGSKLDRKYRLVPGLVVLDTTNTVRRTKFSVQEQPALASALLQRIQALKASGLFEYVEPDYVRHADLAPTDQAFTDGTLWDLRNYGQRGGTPGVDISATNAWDLTTGLANVLVAVIDTGIRYTHYDLTNQIWVNPAVGSYPGFTNDLHGINAITGTGDPMDDVGHGTHVSGTIGAAANDGNPMAGVTWHVQLMGCKFLGQYGGVTSDAITCIDYAAAEGARISNNSWGGGGYSQALYDAIRAAGQKGMLFVAAAGNDGVSNDTYPHYPANYPLNNLISVAAIDRFGNLASFSDYGIKTVNLGAPGVEIYSCYNGSDSDYAVLDGTSMATPHVTGVAALILSLYPTADLNEVRQRLLLGTVPLPSLNGKTTTGGRLDAYRALTITGRGQLQVAVDPPSGANLLAGSTQPVFVKVTDLFGVTDASVTAAIPGVTNLTFLNDGTPPDVISNDDTYSAMFDVPAKLSTITMTIEATATNKVGVTNTVYYNIVPPPPNDFFTNAIKVPNLGAVYPANNLFATMETDEPAPDGNTNAAGSLWWVWSPPQNTNVFIDTAGSAVDVDLAVYTGAKLASLQTIAATNSVRAQHQPAFLSFNARAGQAYYITVAGIDTNNLGSIQLRVAPGGAPDQTPPEAFISSVPSGSTVTNRILILSGSAVDPPPNASGLQQVNVSVNGALPASASGTTNWNSPVLLQSGLNTIQVTAIDQADNTSFPATIQLNYFVQNPVNDFFSNPIILTGTNGMSSVITTNATREAGEPIHAGNRGGHSAWWSFTAPADGVLTLSTTNSSFDTLLGLYTGTVVSNLTTIADNDDAYPAAPGGFSYLDQAVRADVTYHIAIDGYDGASGVASLTYSFTPSVVYHVTANATAGGAVQLAQTNALGGTQAAPSDSSDFASGSTAVLSATPNPDYTFAGWTGDGLSSQSASANPLSITVSGDLTLTASFSPVVFTDGFESGDLTRLPWVTSGNAPWFVQSDVVETGQYAARSGAIGDNESSTLMLTTNLEAGNAAFDYKVSSETNFDTLTFWLDSTLLQRWSGEVGWSTYVFPVTKGVHTLKWVYQKDATTSAGLDAAFIDNLNLPVAAPPIVPATVFLQSQPDHSVLVGVHGQTNQQYVVQASANLTSWFSISTNSTGANGLLFVPDPASATNNARFYRSKLP
jgi:uncharacterized repeat protein (TIGR02543 family)